MLAIRIVMVVLFNSQRITSLFCRNVQPLSPGLQSNAKDSYQWLSTFYGSDPITDLKIFGKLVAEELHPDLWRPIWKAVANKVNVFTQTYRMPILGRWLLIIKQNYVSTFATPKVRLSDTYAGRDRQVENHCCINNYDVRIVHVQLISQDLGPDGNYKLWSARPL